MQRGKAVASHAPGSVSQAAKAEELAPGQVRGRIEAMPNAAICWCRCSRCEAGSWLWLLLLLLGLCLLLLHRKRRQLLFIPCLLLLLHGGV